MKVETSYSKFYTDLMYYHNMPTVKIKGSVPLYYHNMPTVKIKGSVPLFTKNATHIEI